MHVIKEIHSHFEACNKEWKLLLTAFSAVLTCIS